MLSHSLTALFVLALVALVSSAALNGEHQPFAAAPEMAHSEDLIVTGTPISRRTAPNQTMPRTTVTLGSFLDSPDRPGPSVVFGSMLSLSQVHYPPGSPLCARMLRNAIAEW